MKYVNLVSALYANSMNGVVTLTGANWGNGRKTLELKPVPNSQLASDVADACDFCTEDTQVFQGFSEKSFISLRPISGEQLSSSPSPVLVDIVIQVDEPLPKYCCPCCGESTGFSASIRSVVDMDSEGRTGAVQLGDEIDSIACMGCGFSDGTGLFATIKW